MFTTVAAFGVTYPFSQSDSDGCVVPSAFAASDWVMPDALRQALRAFAVACLIASSVICYLLYRLSRMLTSMALIYFIQSGDDGPIKIGTVKDNVMAYAKV